MGEYFFPFPQLEFQNPDYPEITYKIEDILFDTGNEADYKYNYSHSLNVLIFGRLL